MNHLGYIVAAYAVAAAVVAGLVAWVVADNRTQKRRLDRLEAERRGRTAERTNP
ncbi:heme exporter protein CcmD [Propylenella binzhouense]|uniref:Heme exporter protein D n=1 Tax=Propylenella binzhouense TaxID=2555902 RepID=A0A964WUN4_9HYPH|nr:heme exporter protein CcmD [Propylenella binzhouense]